MLDNRKFLAYDFVYSQDIDRSEGKEVGGTRWAIRIAKKYNILIYNIGSEEWGKQTERGKNEYGYDVFGSDYGDFFSVGDIIPIRTVYHLTGIKMAMEQLKKEDKNEKN